MDNLLSIRDLSVEFQMYEGTVRALDNVNLDIGRQETFGLVGETGSGKSMTALSILRLVPHPGRIVSGSILFDPDSLGRPRDLLQLTEQEMRELRGSTISMVFQEPSAALNPVFSIGDQIAEVILLHRHPEVAERALAGVTARLEEGHGPVHAATLPFLMMEKALMREAGHVAGSFTVDMVQRLPLLRRLTGRLKKAAMEMAVEALRQVEIPDPERVVRAYPHELSGGMKQRAMIAAALACSPRFLIADEPTTALDVTIQAQILDLLRRLRDERQASVLYITHDLAVAAELCDRIGVMYSGSICEVASVGDLFANPLHPYTLALMAAVPRPGQRPQAIGGDIPDPLHLPSGCRFHPRCPRAETICRQEPPALRQIQPGHRVACHLA